MSYETKKGQFRYFATVPKKENRYKGRKPALTGSLIAEIRKKASSGEKKTDLVIEYNVSRRTIYNAFGGA